MARVTIVLGIVVLLAACTTSPSSQQVAFVDDLENRDYVAVLVPELDGEDQVRAFSAGVAQALGTEKVVPTLPDTLAGPSRSALQVGVDIEAGPWLQDVAGVAEETFDFDTIVLATARPTTQQQGVFGIMFRTQEVTEVVAAAFDVSETETIAQIVEYVPFNENSAVGSITAAGREGMNALLEAPMAQ